MTHTHLSFTLIHADGAVLLGQLPSAPQTGGSPASQPATSENGSPIGQPGSGTQAQPQSPFGGQFLFILLAFMLFMILMSVFSNRKEKKRRQEMLGSLGRHDRVMMSGGMIGTITDIRDDEIVLKVDESTNTRIHFAKSAVQSVLKSAGSPQSEADTEAA